MDRSQKTELVSSMREALQKAKVVVVTQQLGLSVAEATTLRRQMRDSQAHFKVLKNTLAQLVVKDTPLEGISSLFKGPTAIAFSQDPVGAAKAAAKFAEKNDKLVIIGGYMDGQILSPAAVKSLATLPSLDELRSMLIALVSAPATKLAILTKEPAARLARVLSAKSVA